MEQSAGKVSMLVAAPQPPVITRPNEIAICNTYKQQMINFHWANCLFSYKPWFCSPDKNYLLGNCLLGRWSLGQGGGWRVPRREGEKSPEPSSGKEYGMNNHYEGQEACRCHPNRKHIQNKILNSWQELISCWYLCFKISHPSPKPKFVLILIEGQES